MNTFQLFFHHLFRFIWNLIFILSYPILASFGLLFIGLTWIFSKLSQVLTRLKPEGSKLVLKEEAWQSLANTSGSLESKLVKSILFGPSCYQFRRADGVPSILSDFVFGGKVHSIEEGFILEKWNSTESKDLPDFEICLYDPDEDRLQALTQIKCFDWHISERDGDELFFKWFDGIQGGEVKVGLV